MRSPCLTPPGTNSISGSTEKRVNGGYFRKKSVPALPPLPIGAIALALQWVRHRLNSLLNSLNHEKCRGSRDLFVK